VEHGVIARKISGMDFPGSEGKPATVVEQVDKLLRQAVDPYNLCRNFPGWFPFW
jgi:phosphatidylinositol kinase/protein kinase (PI-3  family)